MNWAYIAGFFDGEGHVRVPLGASGRGLVWTQASRPVLEQIVAFMKDQGIASIIYRYERAPDSRERTVFHLYITNTPDVVHAIREMRPYLIVKKQVAEDVWRFAKLYPSREPGNARYCKHGHLLSGANVRQTVRQRICLPCKRARERKSA